MVVVNGKFMAERMQGVVRYGRELMLALDGLVDEGTVTLAVPRDVREVPDYKNISVKVVGKHTGIAWEQIDLALYMMRHRDAILINLCNTAPLLGPAGVTTIHDVMYKVNPQDYTSFRNRVSRCWHLLQYSVLARREKRILTVSNFSKGEIERCYPKAKGRIEVVPCAWQHVLRMPRDDGWRKKFPFLVPKEYFFTCATRAKNKNGKWIMEVAKRNPDCVFAVAGGSYSKDDGDVPENVFVLGFISDGELRSLIENCRAFLFPSFSEGFGLPPLEALALGAEVIAANRTSLPEILDNSVRYINPEDYQIALNELLEKEVNNSQSILMRYSWIKAANKLLTIIDKLLYTEI